MSEKVNSKIDLDWKAWLFLGVVLAMLAVTPTLAWLQRSTRPAEVLIDGRITVSVEVADTDFTRERGLSGHEPLAEDEGMFFIFPAASRYSFWMKEMLFPIDIIWIRGTEIVDITADVQPPTNLNEPLPKYPPITPADKVLEVPAGFALKHGLRLGMPVELRY